MLKKTVARRKPETSRGKKDDLCRLAISGALFLLTLVVFWPVLGHGFINYDDNLYVVENPHVRGGLTLENVRWAWTAQRASNWHPLTWLSHMLDCELYGLRPGRHHLTSLLLHSLSAVVFFLVLQRITEALWRSAFVAALFAVHPLHVESVAWIAERKDVLSTFFFMLTLASYAYYASGPKLSRYMLVVLFLALGLMAKPMLVTLPFLLLLLDFWPLGRIGARFPARLVLEKIPLFVLAAASSVVTFSVQHAGKAVESFDQYPLWTRVSNAAVSYITYVHKMVWPQGLAIFYPHHGPTIPTWRVGVSVGLLLGLTALAWRGRRTWPYLLVGWLWFLGTLVPVIGLVQLGDQAMADRYTYIPLIGLFVVVVWGAHVLMTNSPAAPRRHRIAIRIAVLVGAAAVIVAFASAARVQVGYWRNSETLFRHALVVTERNHTAHINLALALADQGALDEVIAHLREAVRIKPDHAKAQHNLGVALSHKGQDMEAHQHFVKSVELEPAYAEAHYNLGISFAKQGKLDEALESFSRATDIDPTHAPAHYQYGTLLAQQGRWDAAIARLSRSLSIYPSNAKAHYNLAVALYKTGSYAEAWREVRLAERFGFSPPVTMIQLLQRRMPEPGQR